MNTAFVTQAGADSALAVLVSEGLALGAAAARLDADSQGGISRALTQAKALGRFTGAKGQTLLVPGLSGVSHPLVVLVGAGKLEGLAAADIEGLAAGIYGAVKLSGAKTLALDLDLNAEFGAHAAFGVRLASYRFDRYLTKQKPEKIPSIAALEVVTTDAKAAEAAFAPLNALADGVFFTRDLVSEPANILYPAEFAARCKALESLGLQVEILGEAEMKTLGMDMLLGVGLGSERDSQLCIMRWNGNPGSSEAPLAFVGKGVCFDTGGISLKPGEGMEEMKWDMGGAGAVAGLMHALAGRKAKVNVIGVLGLVENMPDGKAQRPGDIVKSMSGQTVEVINTDAEGRLVLGDALWYTKERFKPKFMIDLATLTGAMIISLGLDYAGVFTNSDEIAEGLAKASKVTGENSWRMPLPSQYEKMIDTAAADMKNIGGRPAGSITAALFLQRFVGDTPWAHIDIAPTAWTKDNRTGLTPEGATGYGVRLLNQFIKDHYEA